MNYLNRSIGFFFIDQHRDFDFTGGDHTDVDVGIRQRAKHGRSHTGMRLHTGAITGRFGTMLNVYTKPEYRRQGISRKLVSMALEYARKEQLSYVELDSTNDGLALYKSLEFEEKVSRYTPMVYKLLEK